MLLVKGSEGLRFKVSGSLRTPRIKERLLKIIFMCLRFTEALLQGLPGEIRSIPRLRKASMGQPAFLKFHRTDLYGEFRVKGNRPPKPNALNRYKLMGELQGFISLYLGCKYLKV